MTTHIASTQHDNNHGRNLDGEMIHTPPVHEEIVDMPLSSSPPSSPKMMKHELSYSQPPQTMDGIEKKKRKYSACLFRWTQEMWESARQDMERRSSVSSASSTVSQETPSSPKKHTQSHSMSA